MGKNNKGDIKSSKKSSKTKKMAEHEEIQSPEFSISSRNQKPSLPSYKPGHEESAGNSEASQALGASRAAGSSRKPQMPSPNAVGNTRRGGLGRGLASLIPSGPARPSLGDGAADIVLGNGSGNGASSKRAGAVEETSTADAKPKASLSVVRPPRSSSESISDANRKSEGQKSARGAKSKGTPGMVSKRHSDGTFPDGIDERHAEADPSMVRSVGDNEANVSRETSSGDFGATYQEIPLDSIRTNAKQPREVFDEDALQELVHSLKEFGLMQPIVVRMAPDGDSTYELIMGERRLRAAGRAGFEVIPAIVRETADNEMLRDALLENIHRVQLNPLEEAAAYQQLMEEFGVTQEQLAKKIGRSRPLITNMIRLLQLPVAVQRRVGAGVLSAGHARALLGLKSGADEQEKLANRVVSEGLSVRATEEAVTLLNRGDKGSPNSNVSTRQPQPLPEEVSTWVDNAADALDTKVSVQMGKKKGKIVVEFGGPDDFDRIIELLKFK